MDEIASLVNESGLDAFLAYCGSERRLDAKTVRAYRVDLRQLLDWASTNAADGLDRTKVRAYLAFLNAGHAPSSVKRKMASLRAFLNYLAEEGLIVASPMAGMRVGIQEPKRLPRTVPMADLCAIYDFNDGLASVRDRAILEMLIATGMRVSELCSLDVDIRCIQSLLGHSSIKTTEIYTHVSEAKQRDVMRKHNPRNAINNGR